MENLQNSFSYVFLPTLNKDHVCMSNACLAVPIFMNYAFKAQFSICLIPNRPFPSSLLPLFQSESKCETFHTKMSSTRSFFFMQIKVIFIRMVSHLDSF